MISIWDAYKDIKDYHRWKQWRNSENASFELNLGNLFILWEIHVPFHLVCFYVLNHSIYLKSFESDDVD